MSLDADAILWILGLMVLALALHTLFRQIKPHYWQMRKRRKNYGKVVTTARRPMVMLSAKTGKR